MTHRSRPLPAQRIESIEHRSTRRFRCSKDLLRPVVFLPHEVRRPIGHSCDSSRNDESDCAVEKIAPPNPSKRLQERFLDDLLLSRIGNPSEVFNFTAKKRPLPNDYSVLRATSFFDKSIVGIMHPSIARDDWKRLVKVLLARI